MTRLFLALTTFLLLTVLSLRGPTPHTFSLTDTIFKPGQILVTYSIHFTLDKTELTEDSKPFLDSLAVFMTKYKGVVFEVGLYCDIRTEKEFAQRLTFHQEKMVVEYLINTKGINPDRITPEGYDEARPEITKAYQKNRRAEFKIVRIDKSFQTAKTPQTDTSIFSTKIDSVDRIAPTYFYVGQGCPPCTKHHPETKYGFRIVCVGCMITQEIVDNNAEVIKTLDKKYGQGWTKKYLSNYCGSENSKEMDSRQTE